MALAGIFRRFQTKGLAQVAIQRYGVSPLARRWTAQARALRFLCTSARAKIISNIDHQGQELEHLEKVFMKNGYHKELIKNTIVKRSQATQQRDLNIPKVTLPYIKGTTDRIAKILKRKNIAVTFAPPNTIWRFLDTTKDKIDPRQMKGVYEIPCSCGMVYIGETGRSLQVRLKEHSADIFHNRREKSALAEHSHTTAHQICMDKASLIVREEHYNRRRMREALEIEKRNNTLNRDEGLKLSETWKPIINLIKRH